MNSLARRHKASTDKYQTRISSLLAVRGDSGLRCPRSSAPIYHCHRQDASAPGAKVSSTIWRFHSGLRCTVFAVGSVLRSGSETITPESEVPMLLQADTIEMSIRRMPTCLMCIQTAEAARLPPTCLVLIWSGTKRSPVQIWAPRPFLSTTPTSPVAAGSAFVAWFVVYPVKLPRFDRCEGLNSQPSCFQTRVAVHPHPGRVHVPR
jgi:hypothetical protein